jgi:hypothetical protein
MIIGKEDAYRDFGKGGGHPAKLNFGDCFKRSVTTRTHYALERTRTALFVISFRCVRRPVF